MDLDRATVRIERSLEETREGLRFKAPKTANGKRTISLPANAVAVLREHRQKLLAAVALLFHELTAAELSQALQVATAAAERKVLRPH